MQFGTMVQWEILFRRNCQEISSHIRSSDASETYRTTLWRPRVRAGKRGVTRRFCFHLTSSDRIECCRTVRKKWTLPCVFLFVRYSCHECHRRNTARRLSRLIIVIESKRTFAESLERIRGRIFYVVINLFATMWTGWLVRAETSSRKKSSQI